MALLLRGVVPLDIAAWPGPGAYSAHGKKLFPLLLLFLVLKNGEQKSSAKAIA